MSEIFLKIVGGIIGVSVGLALALLFLYAMSWFFSSTFGW